MSGTSPRPSAATPPYRLLIGIVLTLVLLAAGSVTVVAQRARVAHAEAERLWARVAEEAARYPGHGTIDAGFARPFADLAALLAWAEAPPGTRVRVENAMSGGPRLGATFDHFDLVQDLIGSAVLGARELAAIERVCGEWNGSGDWSGLLSAVILVQAVQEKVEDGSLRAEQAAQLDLVADLDDVRACFLLQARGMEEFVARTLGAKADAPARFLLGNDLDRLRSALAEQALAAVEAGSWDELLAELRCQEAAREPLEHPALEGFGDGLLLGLVSRMSRSIERLASAATAWDELRAATR